jgi:sulfur relay protein TusB/DsrH
VKKLFILKDLDERALTLALRSEDSGLVLMMDAVYFVNSGSEKSLKVQEALENGKDVYVFKADAQKRGLAQKITKGLKELDYDRFIDLMFSDVKIINL